MEGGSHNGGGCGGGAGADGMLFVDAPKPKADPIAKDYKPNSKRPIVLDHGSYRCRVGWADEDTPRVTFPPVAAKLKLDKHTTGTYAGNNFAAAVSSSSKAIAKPTMDGGLVVQWDLEENVLAHAFQCLGITTESVNHPIVMTEAVCNPLVSRGLMSELLFEAYECPSVAYGVDALFSHYYNRPQHAQRGSSLIVSANHHATYVLPVIDGRFDPSRCSRVDVGGEHVLDYARGLLGARYPSLEYELTPPIVENIVHNVCEVAGDYKTTLRNMEDAEERAKATKHLQLPVDPSQVPTEEDLLRQQQLREERVQRMRKMQKQLDAKRLTEYRQRLTMLQGLEQQLEALEDEAEISDVLSHYNFGSEKELLGAMQDLKRKIRGAERRQQGFLPNEEEDDDDEDEEEPIQQSDKDKYYLVDRNVDELTPEEKELRKKQVFVKRMAEAREKMKQERQEQKRLEAEERARIEAKIKNDLPGFLEEKRRERQLLEDELRTWRRQRRELSDRHSGASKARMRLLVQQTQTNPSKKAKNGGKEEDDFGMRDSDWLVYSELSKEEDQSREETLQQQIEDVDATIEKYDPSSATNRPKTREGLLEQLKVSKQLSLAVERFQFPEVMFQPRMRGTDQIGLTECIKHALELYPSAVQATMAQNVFVTGGAAKFPGFEQRIQAELRMLRPFEQPVKVYTAKDRSLDAWRGAALFAITSDNMQRFAMTKEMYEEGGFGYFVEHFAGNRYTPPPPKEAGQGEEA